MSGAPATFGIPGTPSGSWNWQPSIAEIFLESYSRIQIRGPAISVEHVIEARRSLNYICQDAGANRGINLWQVGDPDVCIPLTGQAEWLIPKNTVNLLDCYRRIYTPSGVWTSVGNPLNPQVNQDGRPMVAQPWGDPTITQPASGTLSCTAGNQYATLYWPAHGLIAGAPLFWQTPVSIGAVAVSSFSVVSRVVDADRVHFMLPVPARETQNMQGATPLLTTVAHSSLVNVILPGHGLSAGNAWQVLPETDVGGLSLSGYYQVVSVLSDYEFVFDAVPLPTTEILLTTASGQAIVGDGGVPLIDWMGNGSPAEFNDSQFINGGQLSVSTQQAGMQWTDIFLWPISRNDYAFLPNKFEQGYPTTYWFNRVVQPTVTVWPVPAPPMPNQTQYIAFIGYRMREMMDANPTMGQIFDGPRRMLQAFTSELCAALAEKYKPELHAAKIALAVRAWESASTEDREKDSLSVSPQLTSFFR